MVDSLSAVDLTAELLRSLVYYDPEAGVFYSLSDRNGGIKAGQSLGSENGKGYIDFNLCGRSYRSHRLAWLYVYGVWPKDQIDHINRDRADNRIDNLREASNKENQQNASLSKRNSSGYKGVTWYKRHQKWTASIRVSRKLLHLGYFKRINDAVAARELAEISHFGKFSTLTNA